MGAVFVYGALCDAALLRIVLGPGAEDMRPQPASLPDHAVTWARRQGAATLTARPGAAAPGLLLADPGAHRMERLDFYSRGSGGVPDCVRVLCDGGAQQARTYAAPPGGAQPEFELGEWARRWGDLARIAAAEAMEYFGTISPGDLAGRMPMIRARAAARLAATGVPAQLRSDTGADTVDLIATDVLHAGFFRTEALTLRHPTFAGGLSPVLRREVFVSTDAALVLPYDPVRDRVLMVEQFRMGPFGRGDPRPWMLEPVAGRVDAGETPEEAAHRECKEEAGLTLKRLERIAGYYCTPGYSTEYFHNFVGITDLPDDLPRLGGLDSEAEDIRLHVLDFAAAMRLIDTGEADDGPLILSLLWLARQRERLRASA